MTGPGTVAGGQPGHWQRYRVLYAIIALCSAPVLASYLAYYVFPPSGRTNYGTLITPRPIPAAPFAALDGRPFSFKELAGQWVMVAAAPAACDAACASALLQMRQQRLMTGKERDRVERVWLITDDAPVAPELLRDHEGTFFVRASAATVREFLAADAGALAGHVWLVDPMGNLMLRWPQDPEPQRVKKDLSRLLSASSHWVRVERKE
jgi:cytochrome oxidase Cu insertion factor (SCO1/SenC/PrrC family)